MTFVCLTITIMCISAAYISVGLSDSYFCRIARRSSALVSLLYASGHSYSWSNRFYELNKASVSRSLPFDLSSCFSALEF